MTEEIDPLLMQVRDKAKAGVTLLLANGHTVAGVVSETQPGPARKYLTLNDAEVSHGPDDLYEIPGDFHVDIRTVVGWTAVPW